MCYFHVKPNLNKRHSHLMPGASSFLVFIWSIYLLNGYNNSAIFNICKIPEMSLLLLHFWECWLDCIFSMQSSEWGTFYINIVDQWIERKLVMFQAAEISTQSYRKVYAVCKITSHRTSYLPQRKCVPSTYHSKHYWVIVHVVSSSVAMTGLGVGRWCNFH